MKENNKKSVISILLLAFLLISRPLLCRILSITPYDCFYICTAIITCYTCNNENIGDIGACPSNDWNMYYISESLYATFYV